MSKKWKQPHLYNKQYTHDLPWYKAIWIVRPGDLLEIEDAVHKVKTVSLLPIEGAIPNITVEQLEVDDGNDSSPFTKMC